MIRWRYRAEQAEPPPRHHHMTPRQRAFGCQPSRYSPVWRTLTGLALVGTALLGTACGSGPGPGSGSGSASGSVTTTPDSGIVGQTLVDPGVPPAHGASQGPERPLAAMLTLTRPGSQTVVARGASSGDGRFTIRVAPGEYVVHGTPLTDRPVPYAAPVDVTVRTGQFTTVLIHFDSGIR